MAAARAPRFKRIVLAVALLCAAACPASRRNGRPKPCVLWFRSAPARRPISSRAIVADGLSKKYPGSTFVVENKPGASGNIATDAVAKAAARRRHYRHQHRRAARYQHAAIFETALRSAEGHRADHPVGHAAERARGQSGAQGEHGRRTGGAAQSQSRQIQFRLDRQRLAVASRHGGDCHQIWHQTGARALSELAAGDHRGDPRRRADGLPAGDFGDAAGQGRQGEDAGGVDGQALALSAGRADAEGKRHRRRGRRLERLDRAGRHAEGDHRRDQQGCGRDHPRSRRCATSSPRN